MLPLWRRLAQPGLTLAPLRRTWPKPVCPARAIASTSVEGLAVDDDADADESVGTRTPLVDTASALAAGPPLSVPSPRKLCSLGTGEVMHILSYQTEDAAQVNEFERIVQRIAFELHDMEAGISDVRVCHPKCGEATFVVTVVSAFESQRFQREIAPRIAQALGRFCPQGSPSFCRSGTLMPQAHSLASLIGFLQNNIAGRNHRDHDVVRVRHEIAKWFPRREEYAAYVHWDEHDPAKYTRNIIYSSDEMEILLMCWPARSQSLIHCHDESSCWVSAVEGQVYEVQYQLPKMDKKFFKDAMTNPTGAVGRCGPLKVSQVIPLGLPDSPADTYANNEIGIHRIENRSDLPAITLHVYAPRLRKMKIFREAGDHSIASVAAVSYMSEGGERTGLWGRETDPDGVIDVDAWNQVAIS